MRKKKKVGGNSGLSQQRAAQTLLDDEAVADKEVAVQLGLEVTLFKTKLRSVYQKKDGKQQLVVYEPDAGANATGITVADIGKQIAEMIKLFSRDEPTPPTVPISWPGNGLAELESQMTVSIHQVYLKANATDNAGWKVTDYALWVSVAMSDEFRVKMELPFTIDSVFLKVWKTNNDTIKAAMDITQVEELLD